jgi:hypothetical protein
MRIKLRRAIESDWPFVFSTYLTNNWYSQNNDTTLRKDTWMKIQHTWLEGLLKLEVPPIIIASLEEEPDFILGYVVIKTDPFCYVKKDFRAAETNIAGILKKAGEENHT